MPNTTYKRRTQSGKTISVTRKAGKLWKGVTKQKVRDNRYVGKGGRMSAKRRSNRGATQSYESTMRGGDALRKRSYKHTAATYGAAGFIGGTVGTKLIGGRNMTWGESAHVGAAYGIGSAIGGTGAARSWKSGMGKRRLAMEKKRPDSVFKKKTPYSKVARGVRKGY